MTSYQSAFRCAARHAVQGSRPRGETGKADQQGDQHGAIHHARGTAAEQARKDVPAPFRFGGRNLRKHGRSLFCKFQQFFPGKHLGIVEKQQRSGNGIHLHFRHAVYGTERSGRHVGNLPLLQRRMAQTHTPVDEARDTIANAVHVIPPWEEPGAWRSETRPAL